MASTNVRGDRTRAALIDVALGAFDERGFGATTVDEIVARAGVSQRTFFHHFKSKEDVLFDGYRERLAVAEQRFREVPPERPLWQAMEAASMAIVAAIDAQPELFRRRHRLYGQEPGLRATMLRINEEWVDVMTSATADRLGLRASQSLSARLAVSIVNGANRTAIDTWAAAGGGADLSTRMAESLRLIRPALTGIERQLRSA